MAVCGDPENRHGIILAKNERAKRSASKPRRHRQARRKCPDLVLAPPHRDQYAIYSKRVNAIYQRYTDLVEPFGIDESWLDVTGSRLLFGQQAKKLQMSFGNSPAGNRAYHFRGCIHFNKIFAKHGMRL